MSNKRPTLKVDNKDLLCKNGCGFYGNPSWHYYCSVCYRNVYLKKANLLKNVSFESPPNTNYFTKLEEKGKLVASKGPNKVKNIFKMNKDLDNIQDSSDAKEAKVHFDTFLSKFKKAVSNDVSKLIKIHLDALEEAKSVKIEQHSVLVQKFYERLTEKIKTDPIYKGLTEDQAEELLAQVERYLTIQIYEWAFKPNFSDDETKDLQLQKRIRSLHWITAEILDAAINEDNTKEKMFLDDAITAMIEMNTVNCPQDKLDCIVRCCKSVSEAIRAHTTTMVNADDFLPTLILVLIRANPTLLHSNIQFVMRFSRPSLINSGEAGYMFTNMSIAIEFINTLDHKALNMTETQFSDAMRGIRPLKPIDNVAMPEDATFETLKILENNQILLNQLEKKSDILKDNLIQFEDETKAYETSFAHKIESMKCELPLQFTTSYIGDIDHDMELCRNTRRSWDTILDETNTDLPTPLSPTRTELPFDKENWDLFL